MVGWVTVRTKVVSVEEPWRPIVRVWALESSTFVAEMAICFVRSLDMSDQMCMSSLGFQSSDVDSSRSTSPSLFVVTCKFWVRSHCLTLKYTYSPCGTVPDTG